MMATTASIYRSDTGRDAILALYDRVLAAWPVPYHDRLMPTPFGDTFVRINGEPSAPALLFLHGSGSNSATWAHDVITYSRSFRVHVVDIPGEPGHSAPDRFSCRGPSFTAWLDAVLAGLGVTLPILGGLSLGAWASLRYAVDRPGQVASLVLISPAGICPVKPSFGLRAAAYSMTGEWGLNRMRRLIFQDAVVSADAAEFFMLTGRHFRYRMEAPALFSDSELSGASAPILFLAGEQDVMLPSQAAADRLQRLAPNATTRLFPAGGHAVIDMASSVVAWLAGQSQRTPQLIAG